MNDALRRRWPRWPPLAPRSFRRAERYWVLDPAGDTLTVRRLLGSAYRIQSVVGPGGTMSTDEPFPVTLDLDTLFAR